MKPSARPAPAPPLPPTEEEWAALGPAEREEVLGVLDAAWFAAIEEERMLHPEGEEHQEAWLEARQTLRTYFNRPRGRSLYVAANLLVIYPGQPGFAPDLLAVRDVPTHKRERWAVSVEGKGIDLAMEFCKSGDRRKDFERNVVLYASLGITEYFAIDLLHRRLRGWRLPAPGVRTYEPLVPQSGRLSSEVLDLDLVLDREGLRFFAGNAELLGGDRLVARLGRLADEAQSRADEAQGRAEEAQRGLSEAVLAVLRLRGLAADEAQEARIRSCGDPALLRRWLARAAEATAIEQVFLDG